MSKQFLFIGEVRSERALRMGVTWADGRLAAKQLFDALDHCEIDKDKCHFDNWFENSLGTMIFTIDVHRANGFKVVAMGNKVHKEMEEHGIEHILIIHPAARGTIRKKENYFAHVKEKLCV